MSPHSRWKTVSSRIQTQRCSRCSFCDVILHVTNPLCRIRLATNNRESFPFKTNGNARAKNGSFKERVYDRQIGQDIKPLCVTD